MNCPYLCCAYKNFLDNPSVETGLKPVSTTKMNSNFPLLQGHVHTFGSRGGNDIVVMYTNFFIAFTIRL